MSKEFSFEDIVCNINDAVMVTVVGSGSSHKQNIIYVNAAFTLLSGYRYDEVIGEPPEILYGPDTAQETRDKIHAAIKNKQSIHTEVLAYTKSGENCWLDLNIVPLQDDNSVVTQFLIIGRDLTEQKRMQQELHRLAHSDALTGIANRRHFMMLAKTEFYRAKRYRRPLTTIMFDLDNFKLLNELYGHQFGDETLKIVAENCQTLLRQSDIYGRLTGEKFAMVLPETSLEAAEELADRLCMLLCVIPFKCNSEDATVTASFGVTKISPMDKNLDDLLERVDAALYEAKASGRNTVKTIKPEPLVYMHQT